MLSLVNRKTAADPDDMRLQPGPAFSLQPDGIWTVDSVTPVVAQEARFSGFLTILGYVCAVFEVGGHQWAQKVAAATPEDVSVASRIATIARRVARA